MIDPYETLGVPPTADEAEIRQRYLELVREFPPDRAPERFAAIRAAYDEVRDPAKMLEQQLFRFETNDSLDAIEAALRARLQPARMSLGDLLRLAGSS